MISESLIAFLLLHHLLDFHSMKFLIAFLLLHHMLRRQRSESSPSSDDIPPLRSPRLVLSHHGERNLRAPTIFYMWLAVEHEDTDDHNVATACERMATPTERFMEEYQRARNPLSKCQELERRISHQLSDGFHRFSSLQAGETKHHRTGSSSSDSPSPELFITKISVELAGAIIFVSAYFLEMRICGKFLVS